MSFGAEMEKSIRHHLNDRGQTLTFRRPANPDTSDYDPDAGTTSGGAAEDDENARVAFVNYREDQIDGSTIQRGDRKALMAATQPDGTALTKTPQTGDQFVGEADTVSIVRVRTLKSGSTVIAYQCQVRE